MNDQYPPELNKTPLLDPGEASNFQTLTGSANWIITLGCFDIAYATMALSRFPVAPSEGRLKSMRRVFRYIKRQPDGRLLCDLSHTDHDTYPTPPLNTIVASSTLTQ